MELKKTDQASLTVLHSNLSIDEYGDMVIKSIRWSFPDTETPLISFILSRWYVILTLYTPVSHEKVKSYRRPSNLHENSFFTVSFCDFCYLSFLSLASFPQTFLKQDQSLSHFSPFLDIMRVGLDKYSTHVENTNEWVFDY